jgi:Holliday junction resolvase RusA-like endonuclease
MANLPHGWRDDGEYTVTIAAHYSDRRSRDIDNVAKSILDGLNGVAWQDDSAVRRLVVDRYYSPDAPRADVTIEWRE